LTRTENPRVGSSILSLATKNYSASAARADDFATTVRLQMEGALAKVKRKLTRAAVLLNESGHRSAAGAGSLFIFTAFQYPGVSDNEFAAQCEGLQREFPDIAAHTD